MRISLQEIVTAALGLAMLLLPKTHALAQDTGASSQIRIDLAVGDTGDSDKGEEGLAWIVKALDTLGNNFTITGETLRSGVKENGLELPKAADKVLGNVDSITRAGDRVVIINEGSVTLRAFAHLDKTITFTLTSVGGKPALRNIKGVSVGVGFLKKKITSYGP